MPEPACSWNYYSNNIMHYGGYTDCCGAFTEGQITRMLEYLSTPDGCEYKEVITDDICLPPMANIHILPTEYSSVQDDCAFCFHTEASIHDAYYQLEFYNPSGSLHYTTTWLEGPTRGYCISRSIKYVDEYKHGFIANTEYTVVLTVENECGEEASESITFTLPELGAKNCFDIPVPDRKITIENIYPNPFVNTISYEYETKRGGHLNTWLIPYTASGEGTLLEETYIQSEGTYTESFNTSSLPSGIYYLVLELDGVLAGKNIIKL